MPISPEKEGWVCASPWKLAENKENHQETIGNVRTRSGSISMISTYSDTSTGRTNRKDRQR
jgi:hypothetical protein